jgi:ATP-dependent Lhr-like helicase
MDAREEWFAQQGWQPFAFQHQVWQAYAEGKSGLIHSATGTGKTLAAWLGPAFEHSDEVAQDPEGLRVLWITPLRALASDTEKSLRKPIDEMGLAWRIERRTGDTSSSQRARQKRSMPSLLVTTPESLTLMLAQPDGADRLSRLRAVVVDEWHELMGSKRGVQTELALARLRRMAPGLRTWGVSATLGNLPEAARTLVGPGHPHEVIEGYREKEIVIDTILPERMDRFPWAGHFGTQMLGPVIRAIEESGSTLLFTNTRAMAEAWYQQILAKRPEWAETVGLHHGSLDRQERDLVEAGIKSGTLRAVVCTSSLDLGVDFSPVERVIQLGSPKGVARLLQRAGRSGHRPGQVSRVTCVPTHALELVDMSSARDAAEAGQIERRPGIKNALDVLAQHLVTVAAGPGFRRDELLAEVRQSAAYETLSDAQWEWCLDFVVRGGDSLRAYPEYQRVVERDGVYRVESEDLAHRHRMTIGTIVSDAAMTVRQMNGAVLGTVEESFLSRLRPGDTFIFAGKALQFIRIRDMTAWVKRATKPHGNIPRWAGGRLPLSSELSRAIRLSLERARFGELPTPEMQALASVLEVQAKWSCIPASDEFLVEDVEDREGFHLFFYPFEGRLVHEGLAALFAYRISRTTPVTFTMACNDYGFELLSAQPVSIDDVRVHNLASPENLAEDILASLNSVEMARRQFREVARIAGLVFEGYPGMGKSAKQLQASASLLFDVFVKYDPGNLLLEQAQREVLERQLEQSRMQEVLERLNRSMVVITRPPRPTPMSFPILVDHLRETLTSESLTERIARMTEEFESILN